MKKSDLIKTQFILLDSANRRDDFVGALEDILNEESVKDWKKPFEERRNKNTAFGDVVIEPILEISYFEDDLEKSTYYYSCFLYNLEEVLRVRKYGKYFYDWHSSVHPAAKKFAEEHEGYEYDYMYLIDSQLPEIIEKTRELYDCMKANDKLYKFDISFSAPNKIEDWYEATFGKYEE
jgi:hypothetical protein